MARIGSRSQQGFLPQSQVLLTMAIAVMIMLMVVIAVMIMLMVAIVTATATFLSAPSGKDVESRGRDCSDRYARHATGCTRWR